MTHIALHLIRLLLVWACCVGLLPASATPPEDRAALAWFDAVNDLCLPNDITAPWSAECVWARQQYAACQSLPPSSDLSHFPTRDVAAEQLAFGRDYYEQKGGGGWECLEAWVTLRDAHDGHFLSDKRRRLGELRSTIGPASYYAGVMPEVVPLWRFSR